jgi:hypothetical protein
MKPKYLLIILVVFASCKKSELSNEFRNEIIKYQTNTPLPTSPKNYIYVANFSQKNGDTLFNLIRCPGLSKFDSVSGIYQDELLKPLAIIDPQNIGKKLYSKKKNSIDNFISTRPKEDFPPLYRYKIKNNKITLVSIDTISDRWEK